MNKSPLETKAERLASEFRAERRPALVVEFAGVPKAGKTSTLNEVHSFLRRSGFRCEVVVERASVCPIRDKKHFNFNIWTASTTLSQLLEKTQYPPHKDDPDILFLDRGIFDALCWLEILKRLHRIRPDDQKTASDFFLTEDWTKRVSGVVAMTATPREALDRERGHLLTTDAGGSIMNPTVLKQMKMVVESKARELQTQFRIFSINTSSKRYSGKQKETSEAVARKILTWVQSSIDENILSAPKKLFPEFDSDYVASKSNAEKLIRKFENKGTFEPRKRIEKDLARIQPLPVVVVRNKSGHFLRLIRKERNPTQALHMKIVLWAGGHVRREDSPSGVGAICAGAIRELEEELRLYVVPERLELLGAIYSASAGESAKKHVAFVYEWRADRDDVEVALCNAEFLEASGNSLQGTFLSLDKIAEETENLEEWSRQILKYYKGDNGSRSVHNVA